MKLAIFSDSHLGFGKGAERGEDSFEAFQEAVEKSLDCDAVIIAGDVFDSKEPGSETIGKAIGILSKAKLLESGAKIAVWKNRESLLNGLSLMGMPVLMLAGNHERRAKGFSNPVESLEKAGFAVYLHAQSVVLQKGKENVAVHGLSAVPDQFFPEVMKQWSPRPVESCYNILVLHQIFAEFAFSERGLSLDSVPSGFDFYIDGDVHEPQTGKLHGKTFLVAGSLIPTQLRKEAVKPKGIWKLDTANSKLDFHPLENVRKVYYFELKSPSEQEVESVMQKITSEEHKKPPLVRFRVSGKFEVEKDITEKYSGKALVSFQKEAEKIEFKGKDILEHKLSVEEAGKKTLRENLGSAGLSPRFFEELFEILAEGDRRKAEEFLEKADAREFGRRKQEG